MSARKFRGDQCVGVLASGLGLDKEARKSIEREKEVQVLKSENMEVEAAVAKE